MTTSVALITGAASGLGRQLALLLARDGYRIAALDVDAVGLAALASEIGPACVTAVADVTDAAALQQSIVALGPIDLLIASAGIGLETSGLAYHAADVARVIHVNLIGVSNTIAAVLPGMLARRQGHVVALSSVASFRGLPRMLAYSASKAGLNALIDGLRVEVEPLGIHTTIVCPGWVRTPMTATLADKLDDLLEVDVAARHVRAAIRRKARFAAFPARLVWRIRLLTWLPRSWQDALLRRMLAKMRTPHP